jgi:hypothetical protein
MELLVIIFVCLWASRFFVETAARKQTRLGRYAWVRFNRILDFVRGLRRGICEFRRASTDVFGEFDQTGFDVGRSVGGIQGKPAYEALSTENQTVEVYNPSNLKNNGENGHIRGKVKKRMKTKIGRVRILIWTGLGLIIFFALAEWLFKSR